MKILNLINPLKSQVKYTEFTFPDGQPNISIEEYLDSVKIITRLATMNDFYRLGMVINLLHHNNTKHIELCVSYMLGARMDRRIKVSEPLTFEVSANILYSILKDFFAKKHYGKTIKIKFLDIHSEANKDTINSLMYGVEEFITPNIAKTLSSLTDVVIISPDKGAKERASFVANEIMKNTIECEKTRDPFTGQLTGFSVLEEHIPFICNKNCIIVDDICDGGGTFIGIANELRKHGAKSVHLAVTHGVFSKGTQLQGIDSIITTNSFKDINSKDSTLSVIDVCDLF